MKAILFSFLLFLTNDALAQVKPGTFALKNVETGMYVRIKDANSAEGTPIVAYDPVNWKCVTWELKPDAGTTWQLVNLFSHKTLGLAGSNHTKQQASAQELFEQQVQKGSASQLYEFIPAGKDQYRIRHKNTGLYMTMSASAGTNDPVYLATFTETKNQLWTLHEQHPTI
ncbi:RICIN domain-containing protein [Flavihumibacter petaseus]|uniref:Ricin B lectin domain-containing protein n=1 Tax=Flavihumibacter petaseus NBRC 106054 TaxID=1220578 RepID=A0A0E9MYP0_9BACT|nr:RICIN domain-containing protein [Flavihumibacter petaseus]GAO42526.1 hypothetical protein FPE01S_01_15410 [Flavihumibacter petaseus NBRC 106054]